MSMISARPREPTRAGRTSTSTASPLTSGSSLPPVVVTATVIRVVNPIGVGYAAPVDLDAYVAERRGEWNRLEVLARRRRLSPDEADELVLLYQRAATHLSVVRSHSPDPILLASLSQLVIARPRGDHRRAQLLLAAGRRGSSPRRSRPSSTGPAAGG